MFVLRNIITITNLSKHNVRGSKALGVTNVTPTYSPDWFKQTQNVLLIFPRLFTNNSLKFQSSGMTDLVCDEYTHHGHQIKAVDTISNYSK